MENRIKKIPMLVESPEGHDRVEVPEEEVKEKVDEQLKEGRWITIEKENGKTELLTQNDLPLEVAERFEKVQSITSTKSVKGG